MKKNTIRNLKFREDGIQVEIIRNKNKYSRWFAYRFWSPTGRVTQKAQKIAKESAIKWRDDMLLVLRNERYRPEPKSNTGVIGVYLRNVYDKRRGVSYRRYDVYYRESNKQCVKSFHVGPSEGYTKKKDKEQLKAAVKFRETKAD